MDFILQKSVELGVNTIQPVWMQRSQSHLGGSRLDRREQHWHGIVINACEQCGRARLPALLPAVTYDALDYNLRQPGLRLLLEPGGDSSLRQLEPDGKAITLLVGPEGGLTDDEKEHAILAGFKAIRMGQRVMRTETAALAAISAIQALWGDFA
jgi:16S rRNA (uracil1498-N3)-methyltransferase